MLEKLTTSSPETPYPSWAPRPTRFRLDATAKPAHIDFLNSHNRVGIPPRRCQDHLSEIVQIGRALQLYVGDNQGLLPRRLADMVPDYLIHREILDHVEFVTPGEKLMELPPATIIVRQTLPKDHLDADMHAVAHR